MKIILFINCYQVTLRLLLKCLFKQLQLILTQLIIIIMHATSDSPIPSFTQGTQHILSDIYAMNFSGTKFNLSSVNFFSLINELIHYE